MKRYSISNVSSFTRSKKPKLCKGLPNYPNIPNKVWVSATHTRNYMLNDSLVDWLKLYGEQEKKSTYNLQSHRSKKSTISPSSFNNFIMKKGIEFETDLIAYINSKKINVITISEDITDKSCNKTIELMKQGVLVIHSAPFMNKKNKTRGVIDLLVRSDYLDRIVNNCPLTEEEQIIKAPKLNGQYHYVVIDIKFSTLPLRADAIHILNSGSYPPYKSQLLIYNRAIGNIQGYTSKYAYILGRRWKYTSSGITYTNYNCLDKVGVINYETVDKQYIKKTQKAIKWCRDVRNNGKKWSINPPIKKELYPNMCHDSGGVWEIQKEKIAKKIGEISHIWNCGIKHRQIGFGNGITSWKDPKCTSKTIGQNGTRSSIIDSILDINRQDVDKIRPNKIKNNLFKWKNKSNELFVDFETLSDIFSSNVDLPHQKPTNIIFMIGVYWKEDKEDNKKLYYKPFICNSPTYEEEYRIMNEFNIFITKRKNPKLWYWCAEKRFWKNAENNQYEKGGRAKKNNIARNWNPRWFDMYEIFKNKEEPIIIKDCLNFGLKSISKAMYKHGLIYTKINSNCTSGMNAMILAWNCYKDCEDPINSKIMSDIIKYNKFDCKVLYSMITYLRKNHT